MGGGGANQYEDNSVLNQVADTLWNFCPWSFPRPNWKKTWGTWSEFSWYCFEEMVGLDIFSSLYESTIYVQPAISAFTCVIWVKGKWVPEIQFHSREKKKWWQYIRCILQFKDYLTMQPLGMDIYVCIGAGLLRCNIKAFIVAFTVLIKEA